MKLPGTSNKTTGWLDASKPFLGEDLRIDGKGCRQGDLSLSGWSINFGELGTSTSAGWVLVRITAGPDWSGYIESITMSPYVPIP